MTDTPAFKRGDNNLPAGSVGKVNAAAQEFQPSTPQEQFIYGPTSRPNEPVTHGLPFGPGANFVALPNDNENSFRQRVAGDLLSSPSATPEVQAFAKRMLKGE